MDAHYQRILDLLQEAKEEAQKAYFDTHANDSGRVYDILIAVHEQIERLAETVEAETP